MHAALAHHRPPLGPDEKVIVGHLSRGDAVRYRPGLLKLMEAIEADPVGVDAWIVGRGGSDSLGLLGVFLHHDPADFGVGGVGGSVRTGKGEVTLSWYDGLTGDEARDIATLRRLLENERSPLDRHYMYAALEHCLYRCRDAFASALDDYDAVCEQHHDEMRAIRPALISEFGGLPLLETYRQQAIRRKD